MLLRLKVVKTKHKTETSGPARCMPTIPGFLRLKLDDSEFQDNLDLQQIQRVPGISRPCLRKGKKWTLKEKKSFPKTNHKEIYTQTYKFCSSYLVFSFKSNSYPVTQFIYISKCLVNCPHPIGWTVYLFPRM